MKLTVIIVSYNVKYHIEQCLDSLSRALDGIDSQVIIVDNHSKDGSVQYLRHAFPSLNIIASNHNLGFSRANNLAVRQTESEYILLLNPDTIVAESTIRESLLFLDEHPDAGAVGVRMLHTDGSRAMESRRGLPTPLVALWKMTGLCSRFPTSRTFGRYYMGPLPWDEPSPIDVVSGAYFMVRREAYIKAGMLDEDYFMYGEDIDLSYSLTKQGYTNWYLPLDIIHYKGESTHKSSFRYVHIFYDAMLIFFGKHYGHLGFLVGLPIRAAIYCKAIVALISMQWNAMRRSLGFSKRDRSVSHFLFIGNKEASKRCRNLLRAKGETLEDIRIANATTHPDGHLQLYPDLPSSPVSIIYDTAAYSYADIMRIFSSRPDSNVRIATYNHQRNIVITDSEVITN